ncbi:DEAD/DEAH box helicase family protein [Asticcacaulis machinosus]|uniref:DEAD/DEAH box helicase family protein n=1 Tax=Asticcacaulis machinosus TaxID=2984211 RepID=A0ABT5HEM5_9CAUL|nr:DEAD/DEAH box helicase family protein [Asticcacaulis machinosus]MDC7674699.1 DEAD/DEAH box helicase family protein [Asticcacaulis machinosus]
MAKRTLNVITGNQGAGKTDKLRNVAAMTPGRYLFACPTIELAEEQEARAKKEGLIPYIRRLHSGGKTNGKVFDQLVALKDEINAHHPHAVVFITHETLIGNAFNAFQGWSVMIDEAPSTLHSGQVQAGATYDLIINGLVPAGSNNGWTHYTMDGVAANKPRHNDLSKDAQKFLKEALRPTGVFIEDAALKARKAFRWFSFWSPTYLSAFNEIYISASNYKGSLGYRAMAFFFSHIFHLVETDVSRPRTGQPEIEIRYFADSHTGSTSFWDSEDGLKAIVEVADYISKHDPDLGFWSANGSVEKRFQGRFGGEFIAPLAMGLNKFRHLTKCAFIYSAKYTPTDKPITEVTDITAADITDARETEAIRQMIMRGAIRNGDHSGPYLIYLYEKPQAEAVQKHLNKNGFNNVVLTHVGSSAMSSINRKIATLVEKSDEERLAEMKAASAARSKRNDDKKFVEKWARKAVAAGYNRLADFSATELKGWQKRRDPLISYVDKAIPLLAAGQDMPLLKDLD